MTFPNASVNPDGTPAGTGTAPARRPKSPELIGSIQDRWRDDFDDDLNAWDVTTGPGMTLSMANSALTIAGGTTPDSVTTLLSKRTFSPAVRAMVGVSTTKQANQQVVIDFVSVDRSGVPDDRNIMGWRWWLTDSATTTVAASIFSNGSSPIQFTNVAGLPSAVSTSQVYELELAPDECWWHNRAINSSAARGVSVVRHDNVPNPERIYKMRVRVINLAAAPTAANTVLTFVSVLDYSEMTVEVTAGRGGSSSGQSLAVQVTNSISQGSLPPYSGELSETSTNLASGGTYTGAARDISSDSSRRQGRIRVLVAHQAGLAPGVLILQQSSDTATWRETARQPVPSDGLHHSFEFPLHHRYYRWLFVNGAAAQTAFHLHTFRVAMEGPSVDLTKNLNFLLTSTALAASGVFSGPALDLGGNHGWDRIRAFAAVSGAAGALQVQQSRDGVTWRSVGTTNLPANSSAEVEHRIVHRYVRATLVNTDAAVAQTTTELVVSLVSL